MPGASYLAAILLKALGNYLDRFHGSQRSVAHATLLLTHPGGYTEAEASHLTTRHRREPWGAAFGEPLRFCRRIRLEQLSGLSGSSLSVSFPLPENSFGFL